LVVGAVSVLYWAAQVAGLISAVFNAPDLGLFGNPELFWLIAGAIVAVIGIILMIAGRKKTAQ